jgi:site-specific DNA-methyltransferase (adenine-specific)/adenine-specific DNA-methyltransferase
MPTLDWIGKKAVVNHHREVPFHLLHDVPELSIGQADSGNLIVEGDNLLALKALLPYYAGQVKCIYIDPPYNTGNENWIYNDNVNSPEIRKWLGKVVGGEMEDLSRHDKWLCMMYPRLSLLREMLKDDGAIFISIDDSEFDRLKMIMNEIYGVSNFVCTLIWKRRTSPDSRNLNGVSSDHEYILCYRKSSELRFIGAKKDLAKYKNPDNDSLGPWMSDNLTGLANKRERPNLHYDVVHPTTGKHYPAHPSRGWIYGPEKMNQLIAEGKILWPKNPNGRPRLKRYLTDMKSSTTGFSTILDAPGNVSATKSLAEILGPKIFAFPKPVDLIKVLLEQVSDSDSLILDSFAGSGTTGHAVMKLNEEDGGNRRFILVEMDMNISRNVTAERLRHICDGYYKPDGKSVKGLGSGFRFCQLGTPCFDEFGRINPSVTFADLARHIFFTETGNPLPSQTTTNGPLIGKHQDKAVYLLYNGILKDKRPDNGNVLTQAVLDCLPHHNGLKVIYGAACRFSASRLKRGNIVFKQIPYEIRIG